MADTALKFGPEWLRALTEPQGGPGVVQYTPPLPNMKLAEFRYGREEMLALFDKNIKPPEDLAQFGSLFVEKCQFPYNLMQMSDEESRAWQRGANSDASLRPYGPPGKRPPSPTGLRDRGRGRGRGTFYDRNRSMDDDMDGLRGREREGPSVDRGFGTGRGGMRGGFDRQTSERGWFDRQDRSLNLEDPTGGVSPRKGYTRAPFDDWRRNGPGGEVEGGLEGEGWRGAGHRTTEPGEGEGWRTTGPSRRWTGAGSEQQRGGWRANSGVERERDTNTGFGRSTYGGTGRGGDRWRKEGDDSRGQAVSRPGFGRQRSGYDRDLPEWAVDDTSGEGGSFDDCGKFRAEQSRQSGQGGEDWGESDHRWDEEEVDPDDVQEQSGQQPDKKSNSRDNNNGEVRPDAQEQRDESHASSADRTSSTWDSEPSPSHARPDSSAVSPHSSPPAVHGAPVHSTPGDVGPAHDRRAVSGQSPGLSTPTGPPDESRRSVPRNDHMDALTGNMVNSLVDDEEPQERPSSGSFQQSSQPPTPGVNAPAGVTPPVSLPPPPPPTWSYLDPQGQVQGPFQAEEMLEWYNAGYFPHDLMVRRSIDSKFTSLTEMSKLFGRVPFTPGSAPGPINEPDPDEERKKQQLLVQQIQQQLLVQQQLLQHAHQQQMLSMQQQGMPQGMPFQGLGNLGGLAGMGGLPDPSRGFPSPDPMRSILGGIPPLSADPTDPLKQLLARTQQQPPMPGLTRPLTTSIPSMPMPSRAPPVTAPSEAMPWDSRLPDLRHPVSSHDPRDPRMTVPEPKPEQSRQFDPIQSLLQQLHGSSGGGQPLPNNQHLSGPPPSHHHEQRSHHLSGGPPSHPDSPQFPRAAGQSPFTDSTSSQFDQIHAVPEISQNKPSDGAAQFGKSEPPHSHSTDLPQYTSQPQPIKSIWDLPEPEPLPSNISTIQNQQQPVQKPIQSIWNDSPLPERKAPITPEPTEPRSVTPSPVPEPPIEASPWNDNVQEEDSMQDDSASFVKPNKNEKKDKKSKKAEEKRKTKEAKRQAEPKSYIPGMSTVKPEEQITATMNIIDHREEEKIREQQEALAQQRAQMEALQKLQDDQKAKLEREEQLRIQREIAEKMNKPAPWAKSEMSPAKEQNDGLTLQEIQKMEAERDRKEREMREVQEAAQREEQRRLEAEERARRAAKTINWATVSGGGGGVKSLAEIQAEEARVERERQEKEQRDRASRQKEMNLAQAGVWGNASNNLSWAGKMGAGQSNGQQGNTRANGNPWGNTNSSATTVAPEGFWDPVVPGDDPPLMSAVQRTTSTSNNNNNKKKNKKVNEEAKVKEIFREKTAKPKNDFEEWCTKAIGSLNAQGLDIPTFLTFLMDIESPYEVHDYVKSYIGEGKAPKKFANEYLERRSRWKNSQKNQGKYYDDDLLTPATAINPGDGEFVEAGKKGKKAARSKTTSKSKLDMSHLLGFSVAGQGVNRGELDLPQ